MTWKYGLSVKPVKRRRNVLTVPTITNAMGNLVVIRTSLSSGHSSLELFTSLYIYSLATFKKN